LSAKEVVPLIIDFVQPKSVIDFGCGVGTWLKVFIDHGIADVFGIDGGDIDPDMLHIPLANFKSCNLLDQDIVKRKFDLAISLEVAEHLPEEKAKSFIASLTNLSNVIAFSAAIPLQGGTEHINEQWQEYWENIFKENGFISIDCLRPIIWDNRNVVFCYRQNMFIYVKEEHIPDYPTLQSKLLCSNNSIKNIVHPEKLIKAIQSPQYHHIRLKVIFLMLLKKLTLPVFKFLKLKR